MDARFYHNLSCSTICLKCVVEVAAAAAAAAAIAVAAVAAAVAVVLIAVFPPLVRYVMSKNDGGVVSQLAQVYYDPSQPEGFAGTSRLAKKFPKVNVKKWLATQPAYTFHEPLRRKFRTRMYLT